MDIINESELLDDEINGTLHQTINLSPEPEQADPLETFSTRLHRSKKAALLSQAKARGIAAGLIIEELLTSPASNLLSDRLRIIEEKLDMLLNHAPVSPAMPTEKTPPWTDPAKMAAWGQFKAGWDAREELINQQASGQWRPVKKGLTRRWFSWSSWQKSSGGCSSKLCC